MKALVFRHNLAREAASAIGGRVDQRAFVSRFAPVRIEDVDELPASGAGLGAGRDDLLGPVRLGREADPAERRPATTRSPRWCPSRTCSGTRWSGAARTPASAWCSTRGCPACPRGIDPPCAACQAGRYPWCRNFRSGDLPVSIHLGNCAAAAGAHAERFAAHVSQLFAIPDGVSDEAAVLADPVSVSLRSILLAPPR